MRTILLLAISNIFMTFAWYGHLKFKGDPLWIVILVSWGIAFSKRVRHEDGFAERLGDAAWP